MTQPLTMFTIYQSPRDYPGKLVVRRWLIDTEPRADKRPSIVTPATTRNFVLIMKLLSNMGLHYLERHDDDDPNIVGVFI